MSITLTLMLKSVESFEMPSIGDRKDCKRKGKGKDQQRQGSIGAQLQSCNGY